MILLSINANPYTLDFSVFDWQTKCLLQYGTAYYKSKNATDRIVEIRDNLKELLELTTPTIVVTQMLNIRYTVKRDLEYIMQIRTILRLLCVEKNILYNEFKVDGWTRRLTNQKRPSKKAKLGIVREYSDKIDREEIADCIILAEGVVHNRLQIGKD